MKVQEVKRYKVDNAIIMAAGTSSRFAPISYEYPKALVEVKGEVLIERQIKQLKQAGIKDITIVVGYKKEQFNYLINKHQVTIVENPVYNVRNNHSSLYYVREKLKNTYICSADNYFSKNVFEKEVEDAYYAAVFEEGKTDEWTLQTNENGLITEVKIEGQDAWIMLGHAFFSEKYSEKFVDILENVYNKPETIDSLWEKIYKNNINELPMYMRKYSSNTIFEFDSLDELREFDETYIDDTRSKILKKIAGKLSIEESAIYQCSPLKDSTETIGFTFNVGNQNYEYIYSENDF